MIHWKLTRPEQHARSVPKVPNSHHRRHLLLLGLFLPLLASAVSPVPQRNILLLIADDWAIDSHPFYNQDSSATFPPTPTINALAQRGVLFRNAYTYPVCSPTRAALLTGRYGFRTGVTAPADGEFFLSTNDYTLPEIITDNPATGYRVGSVGKWHLGGGLDGPNTVGGWPHFSGSTGGGVEDYSLWRKVENGVRTMSHTVYATTDTVNEAIEWIDQQNGNPWFLWVAFNAGHTPFHKPPNELHSYDSLPDSQTEIDANPRPYFEAMIEAMDTEIERLLAGVDIANTTIIFLGDNGTPNQVVQPPFTRQRAKGSLYEGGTRVPMIIAGPDIVRPGRTNDAVVHCVDLFATILELTGINPSAAIPNPLKIDSRSLLPILFDQPFLPLHPAVLTETDSDEGNAKPGRAVRDGDFKLLSFLDGTEEFYNLSSDQLEGSNLLRGPLSAGETQTLTTLRAHLAAWTNVPDLHDPHLTDGRLSVTVGWFVHAQLTLWQSSALTTPTWTQVLDALSEDQGFTFRLTDPNPPLGANFYQVRQSP